MTTSVPEFGGCPWPMDPACETEAWTALSPEVQARALALASATLQRLTANRVGNCPVKVRPCRPGCGGSAYYSAYGLAKPYFSGYGSYGPFFPMLDGMGNWFNACGCTNFCQCTTKGEVHLPAPVGRVDEVKVDGAVVDPANYRIDNGNRLVWQGADPVPWTLNQDLGKPDTEVGTFSVTFLNAYPVDSLGAYAVGILALEFGKACSGNKCRLPSGVTAVVRQGVTMEIARGSFPDGMTGIREVDSFISLWNPEGRMRQTGVWSPDRPAPRVQTWG